LDVRGGQRRLRGAARALRVHLEPQLRRPPGPAGAHAPGESRDGRGSRNRRRNHGCKVVLMEKFKTLNAVAAPFPQKNVDTDFIIRMERCTGTPKSEIGKYAFEMARYLPGGAENPEFILNQPRYRDAQVLVCGEFFGTGSSREMAVWALAGMGFRVLIAPSYG